MNEIEFPVLIQELYSVVRRLEEMFPKRHFTPDGHLVGSLGEAVASHCYSVQLCEASTKGYDGTVGTLQVEVKTTQGDEVPLSSCPAHLLVFKLYKDGRFEEHYNGPGAPVWATLAYRKSNGRGQCRVRLSMLRSLMEDVPPEARLPLVRRLPDPLWRS